MWSAPATRTASVTRSHSRASPPSEATEVGQCPAGEGEDSSQQSRSQGSQEECRLSCDSSQGGEGAEEISKVWEEQHGGEDRHHPAAKEATASPIVTGQEATTRVSAQEGSPIVTGQEATARVSAQEGSPIVTGQEANARVSAQEGSPIVTGQEATASHSPAAQEGPGSQSPAAQ
ncbi:hypothetical protein NDU88_005822 [Pleurodeles waltl]|uniref:Uncharacterized protein n=1 Tax=Pleurodeles waltl TaxID=8319 RepID=A0AAV7MYN4_PLEWA|nr:hypothetical protein NDU88_005822 [Pleurodeles waltl]